MVNGGKENSVTLSNGVVQYLLTRMYMRISYKVCSTVRGGGMEGKEDRHTWASDGRLPEAVLD